MRYLHSSKDGLLWISVLSFAGVMAVSSIDLSAQTVEPDDVSSRLHRNEVTQEAPRRKPQQVTITMKDSTIHSVLRELSRQTGRAMLYDTSDPRFKRIISLRISKTDIMEAVEGALKGSGLFATIANDGETIVIRGSAAPPADSSQTDRKGRIEGKVLDSATQKGIQGATITLIGQNVSAISKRDGSFSLPGVSVGEHSLSVRLLGYTSQRIDIVVASDRVSTATVVLTNSASILGEVVTTVTGQHRRVEVGNDIVKINATEILERAPARNITDLIRYAQVPGVTVTPSSGEPGAPSRIRMRGIGSISQNTDPAVIVDGVWLLSDMSSDKIRNQAVGTSSASSDYSIQQRYTPSGLDQIDPEMIESIEIVRGPSAATLYGQEAANGVIVITTKKGRPGLTSWDYTYSQDWDDQPRPQFGKYVGLGSVSLPYYSDNEVIECSQGNYISGICIQDSVVNLHASGGLLDRVANARGSKHNLALRGGSEAVNYSFGAGIHKNLGTDQLLPVHQIRMRILNIPLSHELIRPTQQDKLSLNGALGFNPSRALTFQLTLNSSNDAIRQNGTEMVGVGEDPRDTISMMTASNTVVNIQRGGTKSLSTQVGLAGNYLPNSWWRAQGQVGISRVDRLDHMKREVRQCVMGDCQPSQTEQLLINSQSTQSMYTGRMSLSGNPGHRFDRYISFMPSIGLDIQRRSNTDTRLELNNTPFGADNFSGGGIGTISMGEQVTAGYYVNTNIRVFNRLYFDVGFRQDAGSAIKVSSATRFPKLSTSWLVSDEDFFPRTDWLNLLRLRIAYGQASVHPTTADLYGSYQYTRTIVDGQVVVAANLTSIGNNLLLPERSGEIEGGADIDFWNEKVTLAFTVASKNTTNAIVRRSLPTSSGISSGIRNENIARISNRSVEGTIGIRAIDKRNVSLDLQSSLSNVNNIVRRVGDAASNWGNKSVDRIVEGYQIGSVWQQPVLGYGDIDGNGFIDETEVMLGDTTVYMGWSMPKFQASYTVTLGVLERALHISASVSQKGNHVQRLTYLDDYGLVSILAPIEEQAFARSYLSSGVPLSVSEWRLNSASISYNIPRNLAARVNAKMITVSFQGSNLGLWTNYKGRDPMVNSNPTGNTLSDNGFTLPIPRKFALNFRVSL